MAASRVVVSELLCFLTYKFDKLTHKSLKQQIFDFYTSSVISEAKELLVGDANSLNLPDKLPRFSRRNSFNSQDKENRGTVDIEDIFVLISILKERKVMEKMPLYVAMDLGNIPLMNKEEAEFRILKGKMDSFTSEQTESGVRTLNRLNKLDEQLDSINERMASSSTILQSTVNSVQSSEQVIRDCVTVIQALLKDCQATRATQVGSTNHVLQVINAKNNIEESLMHYSDGGFRSDIESEHDKLPTHGLTWGDEVANDSENRHFAVHHNRNFNKRKNRSPTDGTDGDVAGAGGSSKRPHRRNYNLPVGYEHNSNKMLSSITATSERTLSSDVRVADVSTRLMFSQVAGSNNKQPVQAAANKQQQLNSNRKKTLIGKSVEESRLKPSRSLIKKSFFLHWKY